MESNASENATPEELRIAKQCAPTKEGFVRFQAVELLLLEGYEKDEVARISAKSVRTIERWAQDYAIRGIDGVAIKKRSGRPRKISKEKFSTEIVPLVLDPSKVGETHCAASLNWHHIEPKCLPPYSPDLNPIARPFRAQTAMVLHGEYTRSRVEVVSSF